MRLAANRLGVVILLAMLGLCQAAALGDIAGTWSYAADMPSARQEMYCVYMDGYIYVPGGMVGNTKPLSNFDRYNVATNTWETLASMPVSLHHTGVAALDGNVYVLGGWGGQPGPASNKTYVYGVSSNTWSDAAIADMPYATAAPAVAVYDGRIYVVGGTNSDSFNGGGSIGYIQCYDPVVNTWSTSFAAMPQPRNHIQAVVLDTKMYVCPGRTGSGYKGDELDVYDFTTNTWTILPDLPEYHRSGGGFAEVNGKLYFIGGEAKSDTSVLNKVHCYDPATNVWTRVDDMLTGVHGIGAVSVGNSIYVPGGGKSGGVDAIKKLQVYTIDGGSPPPPPPPPPPPAGSTFAEVQATLRYAEASTTTSVMLSGYSVGAGSNQVLVVAIGTKDLGGTDPAADSEIVSVMYGTDPLVKAVHAKGSDADDKDTNAAAIYYLFNPATGTRDVTVTLAGTVDVAKIGAMVIANAVNIAPLTGHGVIAQAGDHPSISTSIELGAGGWILIDCISELSTDGVTPVSPLQELFDDLSPGGTVAAGYRYADGPGVIWNTWSFDDGDADRVGHALAAFALIPEPATLALMALGGLVLAIRGTPNSRTRTGSRKGPR